MSYHEHTSQDPDLEGKHGDDYLPDDQVWPLLSFWCHVLAAVYKQEGKQSRGFCSSDRSL